MVGASAFISSINDQGGVFGRKITVNRYDDGFRTDMAAEAFGKFVKDGCFAGAFFVGVTPAATYIPLAEKRNIPLVGFLTGAKFLYEPTKHNIFCVRASYEDEVGTELDRILTGLGQKKFAMIHQFIPLGTPFGSAVVNALAKHGEKLVAEDSVPWGSLDVDNCIKTVARARPDFLIVGGPFKFACQVIKRCREMSFEPMFIVSSLVAPEELVSNLDKDADNILITQVLPPYNREDLPTVVLYKRLLNQYYPSEKPSAASFEGFVDAMVLVEGLRRAGKDLTRAKFIRALESIHDKDLGLGPNMKLNYSSQNHQGFHVVYTAQIRSGQAMVYFDGRQIKH